MKMVTIPGTTIRVSRLSFGTASLHHLFCSSDRQSLLNAAADVGITHFDTSPYYGFGLAELDLGRFVRTRRATLTLTTKVGLYPWRDANPHAAGVFTRKAFGKIAPHLSLPVVNWQVARARTSLRASLRRLATDYVDFLLLHEPDSCLIESDEWLAWLESERTAGRVRAWGLAGTASFVTPWVQASHPLAQVVQTQDSLHQHQANFLIESGRELQFTYGYLTSGLSQRMGVSPCDVLRKALERNLTGTVLVSTRRVERLQRLAQIEL